MTSLFAWQSLLLLLIFSLVIFIMYRRGLLPDLNDVSEGSILDKFDNLYYEMGLPILENSKRITEHAREVNLRAAKLKGAKGNDHE
jgi:hypothetical protein